MGLICIATIVLNMSGEGFGKDPRDFKSINRATTVCKTDKRYKSVPCLKEFLKKEKGVYWAVCGKKTK